MCIEDILVSQLVGLFIVHKEDSYSLMRASRSGVGNYDASETFTANNY